MKSTGAAIKMVAKSKGTIIAPQEVIDSLKVLAPEAVETIATLMRTAKGEAVRLKAATQVLELTGFNKETVLTIKGDLKELDTVGLNARLKVLLDNTVEERDAIEGDFTENIEEV